MKLKKPIFWDNKKPSFLSYLLLPLTFPIIINNLFLKKKQISLTIKSKKFVLVISMLVVLQRHLLL